jgi:hypothetical protein
MKSLKFLITVLFVFVATILMAQNKKGSSFLTWGWNGGVYTKSTIKMQGDNYNLTLKKAIARDKHTEISYYNYLHIGRITIPQTNFRLGYFLKDDLALIIGIDHMKYVVKQNQNIHVKGFINKPGNYAGNYNQSIILKDDFLTFEHTDGLNFVHVGLEKYNCLYKNNKQAKIKLNYFYGADVGVLVPKTNVKFLDYERTDRFHVSGYGIAAKLGIQASFWKHVIIRAEGKLGFINMPDIILHKKGINGKAKQNFGFAQANAQIGYSWKF